MWQTSQRRLQWSLWIKDTLGSRLLSLVGRLPLHVLEVNLYTEGLIFAFVHKGCSYQACTQDFEKGIFDFISPESHSSINPWHLPTCTWGNYSEPPQIWTPEMRPPLYWGHFKVSQSMLSSANSPSTLAHISQANTLNLLQKNLLVWTLREETQ